MKTNNNPVRMDLELELYNFQRDSFRIFSKKFLAHKDYKKIWQNTQDSMVPEKFKSHCI